jgi:hypothetical protein
VAERIEPAAHRVAVRARNQRRRARLADVVKARAILAADQQDVAEPLIGDERGAATLTLDDRVRRGGHAVTDIIDIGAARILQAERAPQALHRAERPVLGRGRHLGDGDALGRLVIGDIVGEGAADIGGDAQAMETHRDRTAGMRRRCKRGLKNAGRYIRVK